MSDIRPYGAGQGVGFYWIRVRDQWNGYLQLVAIDEVGTVTATSMRAADDPTAPSKEEAVQAHLAPAIRDADTALKRHKVKQPEEPREPAPTDPATERFFSDD